MWLSLSWRPLLVQCCCRKKPWATWHLLTSMISMLMKISGPWPTSENIWFSLGWSARTQSDWCWNWQSEWSALEARKPVSRCSRSLYNRQCSPNVGGLPGTSQCVCVCVCVWDDTPSAPRIHQLLNHFTSWLVIN